MFSSNTSQVSSAATYIEDVFSTWLYTGNGSTQTITNGIDLAGKGGMVWIKERNNAANGGSPYNHWLYDTVRGASSELSTNTTSAAASYAGISSFNSTGFTALNTGDLRHTCGPAVAGQLFASWTFRKQPKFFDVVTYTGNGTSQTINHNLGSKPGFIIVKNASFAANWITYHQSLGATQGVVLNSTAAAATNSGYWNNTEPTSTQFTVGSSSLSNRSGDTFVAYLFAHNAGGFGLTGTDNVISCGSYTGTGAAGNPITLGYEPQLVLIKSASAGGAGYDWQLIDTMRGWSNTTATGYRRLQPNSSAAEDDGGAIIAPTATGFTFLDWTNSLNASGTTYIYIAIRRGPMKTPTSGTSVFTPYEVPASPTTGAITGFVTDAGFIGQRAGADKFHWGARLMGNPTLNSTNTNAESANTNQIWDRMNGWWNSAINGYMTWGFKRAPGFMDVVCYTGTGVARTINHNLGVVPELMIVKDRSSSGQEWAVYQSSIGNTKGLALNLTNAAFVTSTYWNNTTPTSTVLTVGTASATNATGDAFVAYLFASCPGVSKVGTYTGNGSSQTIDCGFTSGARFVLIKATSTTGGWIVFDSARGITSSSDPFLVLNSTAAESSGFNYVDASASGFTLASASLNNSGVNYIYLAIA